MELFFFVQTDDQSHTLRLFALCLARGKWADEQASPSGAPGLAFLKHRYLNRFLPSI